MGWWTCASAGDRRGVRRRKNCDGPNRSDIFDALPALYPAHRTRLRTQQGADGVDFTLGHRMVFPRFSQHIASDEVPAKAGYDERSNDFV